MRTRSLLTRSGALLVVAALAAGTTPGNAQADTAPAPAEHTVAAPPADLPVGKPRQYTNRVQKKMCLTFAVTPDKKQFTAGGKDQLKENVAKTKTRLVEAVKTVKSRIAPKATIVLVGYPRIAPAKGNCPDMPLAKGDYAYLTRIETELNTAIQAAAKQGGAKYLDVFKPSEGHDVCAKDKAWLQGQQVDPLKAASSTREPSNRPRSRISWSSCSQAALRRCRRPSRNPGVRS